MIFGRAHTAVFTISTDAEPSLRQRMAAAPSVPARRLSGEQGPQAVVEEDTCWIETAPNVNEFLDLR